jgi:hypothetical protein
VILSEFYLLYFQFYKSLQSFLVEMMAEWDKTGKTVYSAFQLQSFLKGIIVYYFDSFKTYDLIYDLIL